MWAAPLGRTTEKQLYVDYNLERLRRAYVARASGGGEDEDASDRGLRFQALVNLGLESVTRTGIIGD